MYPSPISDSFNTTTTIKPQIDEKSSEKRRVTGRSFEGSGHPVICLRGCYVSIDLFFWLAPQLAKAGNWDKMRRQTVVQDQTERVRLWP